MARFDVFANPAGEGWLLDLQADILDGLNTSVVAPLLPLDAAPKPAGRLNPIFDIDGVQHVLVTQFLSAVPRSLLTHRKTSLAHRADVISNAVDMVFVGF